MCTILNVKEIIQPNKEIIWHFIAFYIDHTLTAGKFSKDSEHIWRLEVFQNLHMVNGNWTTIVIMIYDEWKLRQYFGFAVNSNDNLDN